MSERLPGHGLLGWLGRQIGYVKKAVKTDIAPKQEMVYREQTTEEIEHPENPDVKLRRTTIDEVIVMPKPPTKSGDKI